MTEKKKWVAGITKILSANDTGDSGSHQAGILIPKDPRVLSFFPPLDRGIKNPRHHLVFYDIDDVRWEFAFIHYNNKFFGGTRNEFRMTRMTSFIRSHGLKPGDRLTLKRECESGRRTVDYDRETAAPEASTGRLILGSNWKEIRL